MKAKAHPAIHMVTLGCSKNVVDTEVLLRQLRAGNIKVDHDAESTSARTVIINTCGFIKDAKQESVDTILRYVKAKENGLFDNVYVMGCLSERYKKDLQKEIPEVDEYFGTNDLKTIISTLGVDYRKELTGERLLTTPKHYAYLKISEGCDRTCSFCAIPLMRGKHKSKPMEDIVSEARFLCSEEVKELILIAQELTYYGIDLYRKQALPELLEKLSDLPFNRIRLHYAYPAAFPKDVIRVMKERDNICNYLDIPFQHISNKVLRNMRRSHNKTETIELIGFIRNEIPDITLRSTLLVGHPGEGESEFKELCDFVRETEFDRLGVFTYSEEEDTFAARNLKDSVTEKTKQKRADEIMELQRNISGEKNRKKVGKIFNVMIDRTEGEFFVGRTEADSPEVDNEVLVNSEKILSPGNVYSIIITSADDYDLYGEVVQ
jgi:ribosomal protein S12 methylthiotransferase